MAVELHNEIFDLVKRLIPTASEIEWDIEMIADIRDTIQHWLVDKYKIVGELEFYPQEWEFLIFLLIIGLIRKGDRYEIGWETEVSDGGLSSQILFG